MTNFHSKEYNRGQGFMDLELGQPTLLQIIPEGMKQVMRLTSTDGVVHEFDYEYDPTINRISFPLDPEILQGDETYKLELLRIPNNTQKDNENAESDGHRRIYGYFRNYISSVKL